MELYMLCTTFCLLPFTACLPVCLRTTFEEAGTSIPMKGFSCSMGGEGALLALMEGPEADLDLLPSVIRLKTAPRLPPIKLGRIPLDSARDSTCNQFDSKHKTTLVKFNLSVRGGW